MSLAQDVSLACRVLLGGVFVVSAVSKLRGRAQWQAYRSWLTALPLRALRLKGASAALVATEIVVVALVAGPFATAGLGVGSALCLVLAIGLAVALRRGAWQPCHCFGSSSEPLSGQHVIRNILLLILTVIGLVAATSSGSTQPGGSEAALAAIGGLAMAVLIIFLGDLTALLRSPASPAATSAPTTGTR